jgi:glycosyltransferase involved in cell wall biosynthesis
VGSSAKRALVLVSDAFGGRGGIALYNRNLLRALASYPFMDRVVVLPRTVTYGLEERPYNLDFCVDAAGSKLRYVYACLRTVLSEPRFDLIICGHIHLLLCASVLGKWYGCPVVPVVYGIDAWAPTSRPVINYICHGLESFISIRRLTARCLIEWAGITTNNYYYLPNCIDESQYGVRPKRRELLKRYGISGKIVIATAGRLDSDEDERNKGFDEVLEALPDLRKRIPNVMYLVMGDGDDRERLSKKAKHLGVEDIVVFTGYISDMEKADHYRLADVFAMPGSNPLFDRYPYRFVFLEALACGVPVVGCKLEDPWDRNDPESRLIIQVDPRNKEEIIEGILTALSLPEKTIPPGLERFYYARFETNFHKIVLDILDKHIVRNRVKDCVLEAPNVPPHHHLE